MGKRRYEVPLFQRQYVWNLEDHWEPLWEDIERKFVQRLDGTAPPPHFLGAMVLDQRRLNPAACFWRPQQVKVVYP